MCAASATPGGAVRRRPRVELLQRGHLLHALRHVLVALQERLHLHQVGRVRVRAADAKAFMAMICGWSRCIGAAYAAA